MRLIAFAHGVHVHWLGKASLFRAPLGWLLRPLGGIPVDRTAPGGLVGTVAERFRDEPDLVVVIPPEGTRGPAPYWKSGFWHIARAAGVPVVLSFLDFERREGGFGPAVPMSGDPRADMAPIRAFYADVSARFPERVGPMRLREEDLPDAA